MKQLFLLLSLLSGTFSFFSCRKDLSNSKYTISGRLLESTSHPIPIGDYRLQVNQRDDNGIFGGVAGITVEFKTDANGYFSLSYTPEKSTGLIPGAINTYPLSLTGMDTLKYKGLYPDWYPITAHKDTNLNTIYLYKKIEQFVRKVQFDSTLAANDSLEVITSTAYRSTYNTLYGPIAAGTLLVLDTIHGFKMERFSISAGGYFASSVLKKPTYQKDFSMTLPLGDERYREQLLVYP